MLETLHRHRPSLILNAAPYHYGARAARTAFSVLDNANLRRLGLDDMRHWRDALADCLEERQQLLVSP